MKKSNQHLNVLLYLSSRFDVPLIDTFLIDLNWQGANSNILNFSRARFRIFPFFSKNSFYYAMCLNTSSTPYYLTRRSVSINGVKIANVKFLENDLAEVYYFRKNNKVLVLNTNLRTKCPGRCKFCGSLYQKERTRRRFINPEELKNLFVNISEKVDISKLDTITLCTGLFPTEKYVVKHLIDVYQISKNFGFQGEIKYIGAEIIAEQSFKKIKKEIPTFAYYVTVENFSRKNIVAPQKRFLSDGDRIKKFLTKIRSYGFETTILYVLGIDPLEIVKKEFKKFFKAVTRFPIINIFQVYNRIMEGLRCEGCELSYFLKARKFFEDLYISTTLKPEIWENYRGLWYTSFGDERIEERVQTFTR